MFNKERWMEFQKKQPVWAKAAISFAESELEMLTSNPEMELDTYDLIAYKRFHQVMEVNGVLTRTGSLKNDLTKMIKVAM